MAGCRAMRTVVALARASHFTPTVAVTVFTGLLALGAGRGAGALWVAAAVLAGQLSVGWSNDWLDRDRDRQVGRRDKPLVRGDVADATVLRGAVLAVAACAAISLGSGWRAATVHLVAVGLAWSYNAGLKSTRASLLPYAGAFALLPAFVTLGRAPPVWPPAWAMTAGALLGAGAHFANVLPDLDTDRRTGVVGLPHRMSPPAIVAAATCLLGAAAGVVAVATWPPSGPAVAAIALTAACVAGVPLSWVAGRKRLAFALALGTAGGAVGELLLSGSRLV